VPGKFRLSLLPLAGLWLCCIPTAFADSISGLSIDVTSVFDNGAPQQFDFNNITATRIDAGVFDWMHGPDPGTNLEFIPGTPNGDQTRNEFDVNFSNNTNFDVFQPTDTITLTLQLPTGWYWNTDFFALIKAIDVQVPQATVNGGAFTFEMTNLDQVDGNGGQIQFIFDVDDTAPTPEPGTIGLFVLGCAAVILRLRRLRAF
jgi:hypothetical protein